MMCFALFLKNGMLDNSRSKARGCASAKREGFLYFLKSVAVTLFTALSVHCADITTATRNWNGVLYFSSLFGLGYAFLRYATIFRARIRRSRSLLIPLEIARPKGPSGALARARFLTGLIGSRSKTKPSRRSPEVLTGCPSEARV